MESQSQPAVLRVDAGACSGCGVENGASGPGRRYRLPLSVMQLILAAALLLISSPPVEAREPAPAHTSRAAAVTVSASDSTAPASIRAWFVRTDRAILFDIYEIREPWVTYPIRAVHVTAKPVVALIGPAVAVGEWLSRDSDWAHPLALVGAQGAGFVLQYGLKQLIQRPRPYSRFGSITSRSAGHPSSADPFALPSGHATLSFATATVISLAYPGWETAVPSMVWAGGVAFSRPWLGVHYPSDIVAGAVLGTAVGIGMHVLAPHLVPVP